MPRSRSKRIQIDQQTREAILTGKNAPEVITDISFEEMLAGVKETGVLYKPRRGQDGFYSINRYQISQPVYLSKYDSEAVDRALNKGADLVLQRRLFSLSDFHEPFEPSNRLP